MLTIHVQGEEFYDEDRQEFIATEPFVIELEHSLVSLSKWESKFEKSFLWTRNKTEEETLGYVEAMILTPDVPPEILDALFRKHLEEVQVYIDAKMTATWFSEIPGSKSNSEVITAELIYYWMITFGIPFECENWHLNRLFTLIRICNIKNSKQPKMSAAQIAARNRELNERRRAQFGTTG